MNMKTIIKSSVALIVLAALLSACTDKTVERVTYEANVPVYMSFSEFRNSFSKGEAIEITNPGKIY